MNYPIIIGIGALEELGKALEKHGSQRLMVLVDSNTSAHCYPRIQRFLPPHEVCCIAPGEIHKNLRTCEQVWQALTDAQFDRGDLLLNLGGGVIGDLGGFVAATYKRGIDFIQVPTTLLAQVDASVGGKLGIDFHGYKNHIGLFGEPQGVYIWPPFLETLPARELRSGFAEVIKHHLIADAEGWETLKYVKAIDEIDWTALIRHSVRIKSRIVEQDFREQGARKALNFGHSIGHAVERVFLETEAPLLHGEAIATGMQAEAWLSLQRGWLSEWAFEEIRTLLQRFFPPVEITETLLPAIRESLWQDKKNRGGELLFSLIEGPGACHTDVPVSEDEALLALKNV